MQYVDGLEDSEYLLYTAKEHIEGKINIADAQARIQGSYEQSDNRQQIEEDTKEEAIVYSRITATTEFLERFLKICCLLNRMN